MQALRRFWARSVLNKVTVLMSFSLVFCCCGWTGRIGDRNPSRTASSSSVVEISQSFAQQAAGW